VAANGPGGELQRDEDFLVAQVSMELPGDAKQPPMDTLPSRRRVCQQAVQKLG
jgi:hypothetical protein